MYFKSFQARLVFFLISLLFVVLTTTLIAVNKISIDNTHKEIQHALKVSSEVFVNQLDDNIQKLIEIARLLSSDYAFKTAYSSNDHDTILSAMENHLSRISGENIMMLVSLDHKVIANTFNTAMNNKSAPWKKLQNKAENDEYGEATTVTLVNNQPYQVIVVPLLIPDLDAWIYIGFPINAAFTKKISTITRTDVSILYKNSNNKWVMSASTLKNNTKKINQFINLNSWKANKNISIPVNNDEYISLIIPLSMHTETGSVISIINRSLDNALAAYKRLRTLLFILFTISMAASLFLAYIIARQVTRPVELLTQGAKNIQAGNYDQKIDIQLKDEVGVLANSFNNMAKGLAEKEKIHNLLGKVVSPAIAEELMKKEVELGGEERLVTTLFSDVRNFTNMCEGRAPSEILSLLNEYFTSVTTVIEKNNGVVDKYIGDAIMALFGAPLKTNHDANHAVKSAIEMCHALNQLNADFKKRNITPIGIGVGINSDIVVAGNMGSLSRMNYTVIGDGVNLASRLEGLTKNYGVEIIVSEATSKQADDYIYQELDQVRVKGKNTPSKIYTPLCRKKETNHEIETFLSQYNNALNLYKQQQWQAALNLFETISNAQPSTALYQIYIKRCKNFISSPPTSDWDGCYTFTTK